MKNLEKKLVEDLDLDILKLLGEDGREFKSNIAEKLKASPNTIKKHIEDMEAEGIIKSYGVQIDFEKLGYEIIALIELTISKGMMLNVEQEIANNPHVFAVYDVTGPYDAIILARFKTRAELSALVKEINSFEYVVRTNTHIILNIIKEESNFAKLIEFENAKEQKP